MYNNKFFIIIALLLLVISGSFYLVSLDSYQEENAAVIALFILLATHLFIYTTAQRYVDIFDPIYFFAVIFALLLIVRPFFILAKYDFTFLNIIGASDEYIQPVLLSLLSGYLFFIAGYRRCSALEKILDIFVTPRKLSEMSIQRITVFAILYFFVGVVTYLYFYEYKLSLQNDVNTYRETSAYIYLGIDLLIPATILFFVISLTSRNLFHKATFIISLLLSIYMFGSLYARYRTIALLLSLVVFYFLFRFKRPRPLSSVTAVFITLLIFSLTGMFRGALGNIDISIDSVVNTFTNFDILYRFVSSQGDATMFDMLVLYFQEIPHNLTYLYGIGFIQLLVHPIPRFIWPGKPIQPTALFMEQTLPEFSTHGVGFASSIFGDLYWNFGYLGLTLGMLVIGLILKNIFIWQRKRSTFITAQLFYAFVFAYFPMYMRGEFVGTSSWFLFTLIPTLLAMRFSLKGSRTVQNPATSK